MNKEMEPGNGTMFYVDSFEHSLDKQHRVAIPANWRDADGSARFILMPSPDKSLKLMPYPLFKETVLDKVKQLSLASTRDSRDLAMLGSRAQACVCDKQGRIQISQKLAEHAGLGDKVILVGAIGYIQIWDPARWEANQNEGADCYEVLEKISSIPSGRDK